MSASASDLVITCLNLKDFTNSVSILIPDTYKFLITGMMSIFPYMVYQYSRADWHQNIHTSS